MASSRWSHGCYGFDMSRNLRLSRDQLTTIMTRRSGNKFGARKKEIDGIVFDSTHEAEVYQNLRMQQQLGLIRDLRCHVPMPIEVNRQLVFFYHCDFVFTRLPPKNAEWESRHPAEAMGSHVVYQDAKGYKKGAAYQLFRLKKAVIKAALGIEIEEV